MPNYTAENQKTQKRGRKGDCAEKRIRGKTAKDGGKDSTKGRKERTGEMDVPPGDFQQPPQAEQEIDQVGTEKAPELAIHSVFGEKQVQKQHIHCRGADIVADTGGLLAKAFGHGIGHRIAVEHGGEKSISL